MIQLSLTAFFEPTDMLIAAKPYKEISELATKQIKFISPNLAELLAIGRVLCPEQTQNQRMLPPTEDILEVVKGIGPALLGSVSSTEIYHSYWQFVKILSLSDPPATISSSLWAIKEFCCSQIVTQMKRSIAKDEGQDNSCIQIITEDHADYFMRWRTTVENCLPKIS